LLVLQAHMPRQSAHGQVTLVLKCVNSSTCPAGDFGLVKLLLGKYYITNRSGSGTVTHLAPELFEVRSSSSTHTHTAT
jgi:hypothetical protein